jgi:hypothetical protein
VVDTQNRRWYNTNTAWERTINPKEVKQMAKKFGFESSFQDDDGRYVHLSGTVEAEDEDGAQERLAELVADGASFTQETSTFEVKVTVSFRFEDEDGEYEEASDLQNAVEGGDFDWSNEDYEVDEVEVNDIS